MTTHPRDLRRIIVCFMFDGSDKYLRMTLNAVNSFMSTTPHVAVGLLFQQNYDASIVLSQVIDSSRVSIRRFETHFRDWNPTQHKLDIKKFEDEFETIFWLDSDALVYQDITDTLWGFHTSPCKVAFLKDHVCFNPQFRVVWSDWRKVDEPFIPQACFMGFKREIMQQFFSTWEDTWRQWIEPVPFANFPNPVPAFAGSAFCTEQYALGMVLESGLLNAGDIYEIRRMTFPLKGVTMPTGAASGSSASIDFSLLTSFSVSGREASENEMALLTEKFRRNLSFSYGGETSWWPQMSFSGSWAGSFSYSGLELSSGSWMGSFSYPLSFSFNYSGVGEMSFNYSGLSFSGMSFSGMGIPGAGGNVWAPVDVIEGGIVHFYSLFYDQSQSWWDRNSREVIPQLNDYWKNRSGSLASNDDEK